MFLRVDAWQGHRWCALACTCTERVQRVCSCVYMHGKNAEGVLLRVPVCLCGEGAEGAEGVLFYTNLLGPQSPGVGCIGNQPCLCIHVCARRTICQPEMHINKGGAVRWKVHPARSKWHGTCGTLVFCSVHHLPLYLEDMAVAKHARGIQLAHGKVARARSLRTCAHWGTWHGTPHGTIERVRS